MSRITRPDISDYLIHFIRGDSDEEAFQTLLSIVEDNGLRGGNGFIKGSYDCVCFSEAPVDALTAMLRQPHQGIDYRPFGVIVTKTWLFDRGGRPVIYQPDSEFVDLQDSMRWRHVRYEPTRSPRVDFTWEREWRIRTEFLELDPSSTWIVVPDNGRACALAQQWEGTQEPKALQYEQLTGVPMLAFIDPLPWRVLILNSGNQA